jgi:hypothetical protein
LIASPPSERSAKLLLPRGAQRPRICHVPEYVSSAGGEAVELARLAGLEADDWQQFVVTGALGETAAGRWSAPTVGLTVGRQNGKGGCLEIRELYGAFVLNENINHTSHQQKTSTNHYERILKLIEAVPEFDQRVLRAPRGKGHEAIVLRDPVNRRTAGATIFFATRAGGGSRGLTFHLQVFDEAMYLTERDRSSLTPTMAARSYDNTQTWYVGSAVDEDDSTMDGVPFAQVREAGIAQADGVAYFEFSAPGDDPDNVPDEIASDPHYWAMANPALGDRISHAWVKQAHEVEMGRRGFAVEILGIGAWPDPEGADRKITDEQWDACLDETATLRDPVVFAIDTTPNQDWTAIYAAGRRKDGVPHVEVVELRPGMGWVAERTAELAKTHKPTAIVIDGAGPAASLVAALVEEGLTVAKDPRKPRGGIVLTGAKELAQACGMFYTAVDDAKLTHLDCQPLLVAIRGGATRPLGEAWGWSRRHSGVNIAPLVAATLALWGLLTMRARRAGVVDLNAALAEAEAAEAAEKEGAPA